MRLSMKKSLSFVFIISVLLGGCDAQAQLTTRQMKTAGTPSAVPQASASNGSSDSVARLDHAHTCTVASASSAGCLSAADWQTFADDHDTTYTAGTGLDLTGAEFSFDISGCNATAGFKSAWHFDPAAGWTCGEDRMRNLSCDDAQVMRWLSDNWYCSDDRDKLGDLRSTCALGQMVTLQDVGGGNDWACADSFAVSPSRWDDIRVAAETARPGAGPTRVPGFEQFINNGTTSAGVFAFHFDATGDEELFFSIQLPHSYAEGTDIKPHIHWTQKTANTGNVVWGLECTSAAVGGTFGFSSSRTATAAVPTQYVHKLTSFTDIVGTGLGISSMLLCRVYRDADSSLDTFASDAVLLEIDFHYQIDSIGSASATAK